jgi:hypothetical protein
MASKYDPLADFLDKQRTHEIEVTFKELETKLGFKLPASSRYPAWWSNNPFNSVMTQVWLDAGWKTRNVDVDGRKLTFYRVATLGAKEGSKRSGGEDALDLSRLKPVARSVLIVLAKRSGRTQAEEAIHILNEALSA